MNAEKLLESKSLRENYIGRVEVLDKVKILSLLPDGEHMTTKQVAEYYEVDVYTIKKIIQRHRDELDSDGMKILKGNELKQYKKSWGHDVPELKQVPSTTLATRRAILRFGMLLRDSEVAKQIRTYLLNVEELANQELKRKASEFTGNWTRQEELKILNCVLVSVHNGGTLEDGINKASKLINKKSSTVRNRWHNKIKKDVDEETLKIIRNNRGSYWKNKDCVSNNGNDKTLIDKIDDLYNENTNLKIELDRIKSQNKQLKNKYKKINQEHKVLLNVIGKAVKTHTRGELRYKVNNDGLINLS